MHTGDVCTLGIFCLPVISNRDLLDFIDIVGDPAGMVHVSYTNTETNPGTIVTANQIAGTGLLAAVVKHKAKLPKVKVPKTKVLGEKLPGTGVGRAPFAGIVLVVAAALVLRRTRRYA